jgi:hypothetical protein
MLQFVVDEEQVELPNFLNHLYKLPNEGKYHLVYPFLNPKYF